MATEPVDYCRAIEAYLCRRNDGHLVRVVGPSFDLVAGWEARGVPLKVAFQGIDRYFERYYRKGPRRRPVKIDFCDADVLDVFDDWRRALGLPAATGSEGVAEASTAADDESPDSSAIRRRQPSVSLPAHLERVVLRLTAARASGRADAAFDGVIDRVARELDVARAAVRGVRGEGREALINRLSALDRELLRTARAALDDPALETLELEADEELSGFRSFMAPDVLAHARGAALDRLVRERFGLPVIAFT